MYYCSIVSKNNMCKGSSYINVCHIKCTYVHIYCTYIWISIHVHLRADLHLSFADSLNRVTCLYRRLRIDNFQVRRQLNYLTIIDTSKQLSETSFHCFFVCCIVSWVWIEISPPGKTINLTWIVKFLLPREVSLSRCHIKRFSNDKWWHISVDLESSTTSA